MQIKAVLQQSGLDRHEVEVYMSLIQLRQGTAGQLARHSGVPRTYTYRIIKSLEEKGLIRPLDGLSSSVRRYAVTDFEAPQRLIERQQLKLYQLQQQFQSLAGQLERLAQPELPSAVISELKDQLGWEEFWQLLHSTITREIWIINPPPWWGSLSDIPEVKKWEQYRLRQHIWERRGGKEGGDSSFVESFPFPSTTKSNASLILIDQYQVQVNHWKPFRALRIESQEMVDILKNMLQSP